MLERPEVVRTGLAAHPAVRAWLATEPHARLPERIEVLKREVKSTVYRLVGARPAGGTVIAKRCAPDTARLERTVYRDILPRLAITRLQYFGCLDDESGACWLFLQDAGTERFSPLIPEHRALAGQWLGLLHTGAAHLAATASLPDRGPGYYRERLRAARGALTLGLGNPLLSAREVGDIRAVIAECDLLEFRWSRLEELCAGMPATLVHGDFRDKNVHLRAAPSGTAVLPLDWEHAGRAAPAADLTSVDLVAYQSAVGEAWPTSNWRTIQGQAHAGRIFRRLAAIDWISGCFGSDSRVLLLKPIAHLSIHRARLAEELHLAGLAR